MKDTAINIRISHRERQQIAGLANAVGVPMSEWVRRVIQGSLKEETAVTQLRQTFRSYPGCKIAVEFNVETPKSDPASHSDVIEPALETAGLKG